MTNHPMTAERLAQLHQNAQEIRNCLDRHMQATTLPRSKERVMFREDVLKDANYLVSSLEILLREARSV